MHYPCQKCGTPNVGRGGKCPRCGHSHYGELRTDLILNAGGLPPAAAVSPVTRTLVGSDHQSDPAASILNLSVSSLSALTQAGDVLVVAFATSLAGPSGNVPMTEQGALTQAVVGSNVVFYQLLTGSVATCSWDLSDTTVQCGAMLVERIRGLSTGTLDTASQNSGSAVTTRATALITTAQANEYVFSVFAYQGQSTDAAGSWVGPFVSGTRVGTNTGGGSDVTLDSGYVLPIPVGSFRGQKSGDANNVWTGVIAAFK